MRLKRWTLLMGLFLFQPKTSHSFENLGQLITDTRLLVLDSTTTRQRFTDSQITELLNQAQRVSISRNHCLQFSTSFQLAPGTTYYALPSNYNSILRVTIGNKWLQEMTPASLDGRSRGWETANGYPTYYFVNFSSRTLMGFAPFPQSASDTDTIKVEYDIMANDMVSSTDNPFNGISELQEYNHMLSYYAASVLSSINNMPTLSQSYMAMFESQYKTLDEHCVERPNYLPSASASP